MPAIPFADPDPLIADETQPVTNAQKARALIAMLEKGHDGSADVPAERLRDWANDLIRTVEAERPKPSVAPAQRRRLFTKAPPKLTVAAPSTRPVPEGQPSRLTLTAPTPHRSAPTMKPAPSLTPAIFTQGDVRKVIATTIDPVTLAREHPAVIAMTLLGKPSMDQASALRSLPGGQVRAVHRALRQLEQSQPRAPEGQSPSEERAPPISG
ncbi:hypothetical protein SAMN05444004_101472 [Jannaschia faecimaris]|uniref:Uncharacterized protein n=1 Tax=Jannaschia faecimaris TaxID=1244108 RepID=A0A1H3JYP5_9RHOB|nr:hypothetical protein [Jannaschia faecimaris]SDY45067.1 hypothetical protein SAMN05444004_101472 [Jannaschia faecimaris]